LAAIAAAFVCGCQGRTKDGGTSQVTSAPQADSEALAVASLENQQDSGHCRNVLQHLDNLPSLSQRPIWNEAERKEIQTLMMLTPSETTELGQAGFTHLDAQYLSECLLIRAGVRSLRLDSRPPLEQARLSFDWVCRMLYVDDTVPWPVNPWLALQSGYGVSLTRAYAVLAVWQQLGLPHCLVGPPSLKETQSVTLDPTDPQAAVTHAPVRACGVKIDKEIYLFDHVTGKPFATSDGMGVLTLAQARSNPAAVPGLKPADEAKDWRPFLAPPLAALSRRMEWLERFRPGNSAVTLHVDAIKQKAAFAKDLDGVPCDAWNPKDDGYSATRVLWRIINEDPSSRSNIPLRDLYRIRLIPLQHMPRTSLDGAPLEYLLQSFAQPFTSLRTGPTSPRDLMLRGQFQDAISALESTKQVVDNARMRIERDKELQKDFEKWAEVFRQLFAEVNIARASNPAMAPAATKALEDFRAQQTARDVERAFILGNASRPLAAEVTFLLAGCVQERAERAQLDQSAQAAGHWRNAAEWWNRFLDASVEARSPFPTREAHARAQLARCKQFAPK
jgi:hypothetical protein